MRMSAWAPAKIDPDFFNKTVLCGVNRARFLLYLNVAGAVAVAIAGHHGRADALRQGPTSGLDVSCVKNSRLQPCLPSKPAARGT